MYVQARTFLCTIYLNLKGNSKELLWKHRLMDLKIHPSTYKFSDLNKPNAVYLKIHKDRLPFYIGRTKHTIFDREQSRRRKLRQVMQEK